MTSARLPLVAAEATGRKLRLVRAWPRSPQHALVEVADTCGRTVAGQWFALAEDRDHLLAATPGAVVAGSLVLQPGGVDHRLRALAELLGRPGHQMVVHRPGRRAVVRRRSSATTYLKLVRPGRLGPLATTAQLVSKVIDPTALRVPEVIAVDDERGVLELSELPGPSLHALPADDTWSSAWESTGTALRALHGSAPVTAHHSAADEANTTARWVDLADAYGLLDVDPTARVAIDEALARLRGESPGPVGVLHRDLHDKQVLIAEDGPPGLLDLDTLAVGERALDVANLLVHQELRVLQGHRTADEARSAATALLTGVAAEPATLDRLPAHLTASRLRLAGVYAFRPPWREVSRRLLGLVVDGAPLVGGLLGP